MNMIKKRTREQLLKSVNVFLMMMLLFQPVGGPGLLVLAEDAAEPAFQKEETQKEEPQETEEPADETEEAEEEAAEEESSEEGSAEDESAEAESDEGTEESSEDGSAEGETSDETPDSTTSEEGTGAEDGENPDGSAITEGEGDEGTSEEEAGDGASDGTESEGTSTKGSDTEEPANEEDSNIGKWQENEDGSMTIAVEKDVEYEYKDSGLKIKFTRIDGGVGEITVEEIELSDEQVEKLGALSNKAWDITSPMENGTFEYELTLPTEGYVNSENVEVVYAENEADLNDESKIKTVEKEDVKVDNEKKEILAEGLDHFTIFFGIYNEPTLTVSANQFKQGETIYFKAESLTSGNYYRFAVIPDGGNKDDRFYVSSCSNSDPQNSSYNLPADAKVGTGWKAELHGFTTLQNCENPNKNHNASKEISFEVIPYDEDLALANISATTTIENGCMEEIANTSNLNCTANDISIANVSNIEILDDGCAFPGDTVTFKATWDVQSTATERYDIGLYFSTDGDPNNDGALSGSCSVSTLPNSPVPPWFNFDGDFCGDASSSALVNPEITMTVQCLDDDGDNQLDLPYCASWDNNAGGVCSSPTDAYPSNPAKCNCQPGFEVPITVPSYAEIEVVKDLVPGSDPGRFNLQINGVNEATNVGDGGTTGPVVVSAGTNDVPGDTHTVGETAYAGTDLNDYTTSISCVDRGLETFDGGPALTTSGAGPLNVDVDKDDDIVCTIKNTVQQATLTLIKNLPNDNGGTATQDDFNVYIDGQPAQWGDNIVSPGQHVVSEDTLPGYTPSVWNTDCDADGNVTVAPGGSATCDITNDDDAPSLTVVKEVINDNGGNAVVSDFNIELNDGNPALTFDGGSTNGDTTTYTATPTVVANTLYTLTEGDVDGYTEGSWSCEDDDTQQPVSHPVTLDEGQSVTCTI
ncbi:MAG: hypothetical protein RBS86_03900, partial [Candidatus Moranbacteria bacterium]|nr:hypothetical protein [Candidatus Moranbacteria bacterium]